MRDWKLRDTVMLLFMVAVVAVMLMQMTQNDRLYSRVNTLIRLLEANQGGYAAGGGWANSGGGGASASTAPADAYNWLVPGAEPGGAVILHDSARPHNLNIITQKDAISSIILDETGLVYETLLTRNGETLELEGVLAESWSVSDDKLVTTFRLEPQARWSDGRPVTAHDVVFSFRAMMIPTMDAQRKQTYFLDCEKVEAVDDHTVQFRWKKKYYKSLEQAGGIPIAPRHILDPKGLLDSDPAALAKQINAWDPPSDGSAVSSGPYILESWDKPGNRVVLRRNERYWGPRPPLQQLIFRFIPNDTASLQALKAGELDYMVLTSEQWQNQTNDPVFLERFQRHKYYRADAGYGYIGWNNRRKPFDDLRVRQAMSYSIPRDLIIEKVFYGLRQPANGPFSPFGKQKSPNVGQWPFDPAKAKQLLAEAGFRDTNGDGLLDRDGKAMEFGFMMPAGVAQYNTVAALIQDELSKIGVKMNIEPYEWSVFVEKLDSRDFDACVLAWVGTIEQDPYQIWHSSSFANKGSNHIGYSNPEVDRLIEEAREEFDETKRNEKYHRIHEILFEEQPYTFLVTGPRLEAVSKRIRNVNPTKLGMDWKTWWVPRSERRAGI